MIAVSFEHYPDEELTLDDGGYKKYLPKAFGYSIEGSFGIDLTIIGANVKGGINYVVFTEGEYKWYPFQYVYLGYSLSLPVHNKQMKNKIDEIYNSMNKGGKFNPLSVSAGLSPFLAYINDNKV